MNQRPRLCLVKAKVIRIFTATLLTSEYCVSLVSNADGFEDPRQQRVWVMTDKNLQCKYLGSFNYDPSLSKKHDGRTTFRRRVLDNLSEQTVSRGGNAMLFVEGAIDDLDSDVEINAYTCPPEVLPTLSPLPEHGEPFLGLPSRKGSNEERQRKRLYLGAELFGAAGGTSKGLRAAWFLDSNLIVEGNYILSHSERLQTYEGTLMELRGKYFPRNSFYWGAGLTHADWTYEVKGNSTGSAPATGSVRKIGLDLHLGNQWQWKYFTMGCEWAGILVPLFAQNDLGAMTIDAERRAQVRSTLDQDGIDGFELHLLRFYLGFAI
jgi:hypothetical protein